MMGLTIIRRPTQNKWGLANLIQLVDLLLKIKPALVLLSCQTRPLTGPTVVPYIAAAVLAAAAFEVICQFTGQLPASLLVMSFKRQRPLRFSNHPSFVMTANGTLR